MTFLLYPFFFNAIFLACFRVNLHIQEPINVFKITM